MPAYRMKHVPSGLYYRPSSWATVKLLDKDGAETKYKGHVKTNLSKSGKLYPTAPTFKWIGQFFYDHRIPRKMTFSQGYNRELTSPFLPADWVIEEVS